MRKNGIDGKIMTLNEKYHHAILVLQAISQRSGSNKFGCNEWTESEAFRDCKETARRCLLKLGEPIKMIKNVKEDGSKNDEL